MTVKVTALLVPAEVCTLMPAGPVAAEEPMLNVAVICVGLTTETPLTVMPGLETFTVAPERKLAPVRVTGTEVPCTPLAGLIPLKLGDGFTVIEYVADELRKLLSPLYVAVRV